MGLSKGLATGHPSQIQFIRVAIGRMFDGGSDDLSLVDRVVVRAFSVRESASFAPNDIPIPVPSRYDKAVCPFGARKPESQHDHETASCRGRSTTYFAEPAAFLQRMIQRKTQRIRDEAQCVQKTALPRAVGADEYRQRSDLDVAGSDALVVPQGNSRKSSLNQRASHSHLIRKRLPADCSRNLSVWIASSVALKRSASARPNTSVVRRHKPWASLVSRVRRSPLGALARLLLHAPHLQRFGDVRPPAG